MVFFCTGKRWGKSECEKAVVILRYCRFGKKPAAIILVTLQQKVLNLFSAHLNNSDAFKIVNSESERILEFKERFELDV